MASKPGERRLQILQTLATMLESPRGEKITTAALAARLDVSEAALYRHFASKAQMFEGLIEFIESTLFSLLNRITTESTDGAAQAAQMITVLLGFAEKNPGMTRVLIGDALVNEDERLQARMNQLYDRIEASLRNRSRSRKPAARGPAILWLKPTFCSRSSWDAGCCSRRADSSACRRKPGTRNGSICSRNAAAR
jgi:TetR/AcrR family transcriptional regulator